MNQAFLFGHIIKISKVTVNINSVKAFFIEVYDLSFFDTVIANLLKFVSFRVVGKYFGFINAVNYVGEIMPIKLVCYRCGKPYRVAD